MIRRLVPLLLAFGVALLLLVAWVATGVPLSWAKGVVDPAGCASTEADYLCRVELIPSGDRVEASSGLDLSAGTEVELRVWRSPFSDSRTYTVTH
jgi:hypothetical protein